MVQDLVSTRHFGTDANNHESKVECKSKSSIGNNIKTVHELIQEQIRKTPQNIALVCNEDEISYKELGEKATQLAYALRERGASRETIIALMVDRSIDMIVGMLAILISGGAYLPIDPNYPRARIDYMLDDSNAHIVLTQKKYKELFDNMNVLDIEDSSIYANETLVLDNINKKNDLAYVTYTSGSTGKPKGVMVEHKSILNFIEGMKEKIAFIPSKTILCITTILFDIIVLETLLPLSCGLKVVIADKNQNKNPRMINDLIKRHSINIVQATPSTMQILLFDSNQVECFSSLTELIIGGEVFPIALLNELKQFYRGKIYNVYGPTEATVWATISDLTDVDSVNIGKPIANTHVYIVDNNTNLTNGERGELCISGLGLARGYINNQELTKEKFVPNPFINDEIMYKTGDIARFLSNGDIEYIGRQDNQLKLRGFRIELNEIQLSILECGNVRQAVVVAKEGRDGNKHICAYIVPDGNFTLSELKDRLSTLLPDYMIPSKFICLDEIPLTINGKIDYSMLSKINQNDMYTEELKTQSYDEKDVLIPCTEQKMKQLLTEVVNYDITIEQINIDEALTNIGIDSINFIRYIVLLEKEFDIEFNDEDLDMNKFVNFKNLMLYVQNKLL